MRMLLVIDMRGRAPVPVRGAQSAACKAAKLERHQSPVNERAGTTATSAAAGGGQVELVDSTGTRAIISATTITKFGSNGRRRWGPSGGCRKTEVRESTMCRNIKTLHNFSPPATDDEVRASAIQFVRKLSGFTRPSKANEAAFDHAVERVALAARELLEALVTNALPRDREAEAAKARARAATRFGREPSQP
jgi:hypothetical protein